jgi:hypothetical protein
MKLETSRNTETGAITVTAPTFTVIVSENGIQVQFVDAETQRPSSDADAVPPRSGRPVRRRGAQ